MITVIQRIAFALLLGPAGVAAAAGTSPAAPGGIDTGDLLGTLLRMALSLGAVLALVAGLAWLARRLRDGTRSRGGLIEVVSGLSLGTRERVILLRVGREQVLVGVSPAGMRALHVMRDTSGASDSFPAVMEQQP